VVDRSRVQKTQNPSSVPLSDEVDTSLATPKPSPCDAVVSAAKPNSSGKAWHTDHTDGPWLSSGVLGTTSSKVLALHATDDPSRETRGWIGDGADGGGGACGGVGGDGGDGGGGGEYGMGS
jgi:hypothetical protein